MEEDMKKICEMMCAVLRETRAYRRLKELRWNEEKEYVTPVFENGAGEPDEFCPKGWYAVNCRGDSGAAVIMDIVDNFVKKHC